MIWPIICGAMKEVGCRVDSIQRSTFNDYCIAGNFEGQKFQGFYGFCSILEFLIW